MGRLSQRQRRSFANGKRKAKSFWGRLGQMKGYQAEQQFFQAWDPEIRKHAYQQLIVSVRPANNYEDTVLKVDAVMVTNVPAKPVIKIQIKSSLNRAREFVQKDYPVPVVCIMPTDSPRQIRRKTIFAILNMFPFLAGQFSELGCHSPLAEHDLLCV